MGFTDYETEDLIKLTKGNIAQLLHIGLYNTDEHIEKHFGNENNLLQIIKGYQCLLEDLDGFKRREEK